MTEGIIHSAQLLVCMD